MTNRFPVFNVTKGFPVRYKQAVKAINECAAAWVDYGVSIRDLTLAESISARNQQAALREPLEYSELFGLRYEPRIGGEAKARESNALVWQACKFASEAQV
jgi:hypothetical protein